MSNKSKYGNAQQEIRDGMHTVCSHSEEFKMEPLRVQDGALKSSRWSLTLVMLPLNRHHPGIKVVAIAFDWS